MPLPGLQGRTWPDLVKTGYCGKGRIVRIDWIEPAANDGKPKAGAPLRLHSLTPSGTTNDPPWAYEYYQHCLAKAVAWAARGEPGAGIRALSVPPVMERTQLAKAAIGVELLGKEAQSGLREVRLEMRACEGWTGTVVWTNRLLLSSTGQENTLSVPVPAALAPGRYAVHAWLMHGDAVMDWAAALTEIVPGPGEPRLIQEVDMKRSACRAGEPLEGTV